MRLAERKTLCLRVSAVGGFGAQPSHVKARRVACGPSVLAPRRLALLGPGFLLLGQRGRKASFQTGIAGEDWGRRMEAASARS
jgi:hypothetical protein